VIGLDIGGTFTDVIAYENGEIVATKVPTNPSAIETSVLEGAKAIGVETKKVFNHSTTVGLNAVITRRLPKVAFLATLGHRDVLDMGRVWRPLEALTDPNWRRSFGDAKAPLVPRYLRRGIEERLTNDGNVLIPLNEAQAREQLAVLKKCKVKGVAICLLNAYVNPDHEVRLRKLVTEVLGDIPCSISSEVSPLAKEYARASTTVIDVFMKIVFGDYIRRLLAGLRDLRFKGEVNLADCAAMLVPEAAAMERPFRIMYSGPAAGTISTAYFGRIIGDGNIICCDIGGTSSDISLVKEGRPFVNTTFEIEHDMVVNTLANEIFPIGAGGGSIVSIGPTGDMTVGPESAGADPGPACYGKGKPGSARPTVTDACLLIGILDPRKFLGGKVKLYPELARKAFQSLETNIPYDLRIRYAYNLALNNITEGLIDIIVRHGVDPRDFSLMAYGAAGAMLLPAIMEQIGVRRIIVPPFPGLFSALGLLSSDLVFTTNRSAYLTLRPDACDRIDAIYAGMEENLLKNIADPERAAITRTFDAHLAGQTWETPFISVPPGKVTRETIAAMLANFHEEYDKRWGNRFEFMPVVSATYRSQATIPVEKVRYRELPARGSQSLAPVGKITLRHLFERDVEVLEYSRESLCRGDVIEGYAIIRETMSTIQVVAGQVATVGKYGEIVIERKARI
jgi:N-methylhydantoinase A